MKGFVCLPCQGWIKQVSLDIIYEDDKKKSPSFNPWRISFLKRRNLTWMSFFNWNFSYEGVRAINIASTFCFRQCVLDALHKHSDLVYDEFSTSYRPLWTRTQFKNLISMLKGFPYRISIKKNQNVFTADEILHQYICV